jgi:hypothetical protein
LVTLIVRFTVGATVSDVNVSTFDAWLPVEEETEAAWSAFTWTVTEPSAVGSTSNVKTVVLAVVLAAKFIAVPPVTEISPEVNPLTGSENVAVTGMSAAFVAEALVLDRTTVGPPTAAEAN